MARPLRIEFPGAVYHITARGNARQDIFLEDSDRRRFLELLGREVEQQRWRCYAYCLMGNHYHLLIETPEPNLAQGMRRLQGTYTQGFNRRHGRVGHLFQGRYKSILVEGDAYGLELCRYIVLNPVRAGWARHPGDWRWSSYLQTTGVMAAPAWLDTAWILGQFSQDAAKASDTYERFVAQGIGGRSPWEDLRGQIWLGGNSFREEMERRLKGKALENVPLR
ncbi:MAG: REP-associated tyrosine transposase [Methylohalobius sp. ZOD2]